MKLAAIFVVALATRAVAGPKPTVAIVELDAKDIRAAKAAAMSAQR